MIKAYSMDSVLSCCNQPIPEKMIISFVHNYMQDHHEKSFDVIYNKLIEKFGKDYLLNIVKYRYGIIWFYLMNDKMEYIRQVVSEAMMKTKHDLIG